MKKIVISIFAACSVFGLSGSWAEDTPYVNLRSLTAPLATQLALAAYKAPSHEQPQYPSNLLSYKGQPWEDQP